MSIAGARSNRGDAYQVAMAVQWAIRALTESDIEWIEIDSTRQIAGGIAIPVDDIVVGYSHGRMTCIQCKKNEPRYRYWDVKGLADELVKAATILVNEPAARVVFSSRADFADLAKLKEYATQTPDTASFEGAIGQNLAPELTALKACWTSVLSGSSHTVHDLLGRIEFDPTESVDALPARLKAQLGQIATRVDDAYNALWTSFDTLGARLLPDQAYASSHRITRDELREMLWKAGSAIAPPRTQADILRKFSTMSGIGKHWRRDAGGREVDRPAVDELLAAIDAEDKLLLLTDAPGAGKTVALLQLVQKLEARADIATLFLQSREFADAGSHDERVARGLDADVPALVSAMSQWRKTVVVIDSLDVLSLARDNDGLTFFLSLMDRLGQIPRVSVVVACRNFDLQYNRKLANRRWDRTVEVKPLDWATVVRPLLVDIGIAADDVDEITCDLLGNPRNLALYVDVARKTGRRILSSAQELTEAYLQAVVRDESMLGDPAMVAVEAMAAEMLTRRSLQVPRSRIVISDPLLDQLLSLNVLFRAHDGKIGFGHQTLLDTLAVQDAERKGLNFREFIQALQPVPFVRPAIRAFFTHLRLGDAREFRAQVRAVFDATDVAFHIKRLIAESLGELAPQLEDWRLIQHLFNAHEVHFRSLYFTAARVEWNPFWLQHFIPFLQKQNNTGWMEAHARRIDTWMNADAEGVVQFWTSAARATWSRDMNLRAVVGVSLQRSKRWAEVDVQPLFEALLSLPSSGYDFLGDVLLQWGSSHPQGNELAWRYVVQDVPTSLTREREVEQALRCDNRWLRKPELLAGNIAISTALLDRVVASIEAWSRSINSAQGARGDDGRAGPNRTFLDETSFGKTHSRFQIRHVSALATLLGAVEAAVLAHGEAHDDWWRANERRLCLNDCGALRHMGMIAMTRNPQTNAEVAAEFFSDLRRVELADVFELGNLIAATAYPIGDAIELVQQRIFELWSSLPEKKGWVEVEQFELLKRIPASLRSVEAVEFIERLLPMQPLPTGEPRIYSSGGMVPPPFSVEKVLALSDDSLAMVLVSSADLPEYPAFGGEFSGGIQAIHGVIHGAAAKAPERLLRILKQHWSTIAERFRAPALEGAASCLRYRHGNLQPPTADWKPDQDVGPEVLANLILDELQRHPDFWADTVGGQRAGAAALLACAQAAKTDDITGRVLSLSAAFLEAEDPACDERLDGDLIDTAINCARGEVAQGLIAIANHSAESGREFPALLTSSLMRMARDCHPAVRAVLLRDLAYLQYKQPVIGWELFALSFQGDDERVWEHAEACLFYAHDAGFDRIKPYLDRMKGSELMGVRELWAKICALSCLTGHIRLADFITELKALQDDSAWGGASLVWATNARQPEHGSHCYEALILGIGDPIGRQAILKNIRPLFEKGPPVAQVPMALFRVVFVEPSAGDEHIHLFSWIDEWICELAEVDSDLALEAAEVVATACQARGQNPFHDPQPLGTLLTTLFREAEERELSDKGVMLNRTVALQDAFMALPSSSLADWLRDAERPNS